LNLARRRKQQLILRQLDDVNEKEIGKIGQPATFPFDVVYIPAGEKSSFDCRQNIASRKPEELQDRSPTLFHLGK